MGVHISQQSLYLEIPVVVAGHHVAFTLAPLQRLKDSRASCQVDHGNDCWEVFRNLPLCG